jgi:predicted transcriptional regulator
VDIKLTDREAQLMDVLWRNGPSTVSEARAALTDELAYTTVLTVLRTLEGKGYVKHTSEGRSHRYFASVTQGKAQRSASRALVRKLFDGSTELLLTHLVTDAKLSDGEVRRIKDLLDQRPGKEGKS